MQQTKRGRAMKSALLFIQVLCFRLHQIELALPGSKTVRNTWHPTHCQRHTAYPHVIFRTDSDPKPNSQV